ncbi:hypothetical protein THASP1DRAFT_23524 [Thamnocephalis sphaerospora]|uniref:Gag1-like clamp domain-containing protein n=1 Tax=Thamnocephalis sphaerospora TaxID=78915 RepID=A0A4P9XSW3_9FUNG|nr:hypothetical protein THASP1DRAFT_23524 [Thamnocephalis sphaerospora]|eukprot:RKP08500.1 hypothetical protein THASP1DRAFT_23524 [Thamnocephalis sphaerospora]
MTQQRATKADESPSPCAGDEPASSGTSAWQPGTPAAAVPGVQHWETQRRHWTRHFEHRYEDDEEEAENRRLQAFGCDMVNTDLPAQRVPTATQLEHHRQLRKFVPENYDNIYDQLVLGQRKLSRPVPLSNVRGSARASAYTWLAAPTATGFAERANGVATFVGNIWRGTIACLQGGGHHARAHGHNTTAAATAALVAATDTAAAVASRSSEHGSIRLLGGIVDRTAPPPPPPPLLLLLVLLATQSSHGLIWHLAAMRQ